MNSLVDSLICTKAIDYQGPRLLQPFFIITFETPIMFCLPNLQVSNNRPYKRIQIQKEFSWRVKVLKERTFDFQRHGHEEEANTDDEMMLKKQKKA